MSIILQGFVDGSIVLQGYGGGTPVVLPTLIVEDGTAKVDAESFCSVDFADDYFLRRMVTSWASLTLSQKEADLRKATDYLEQEFRLRWAGYKYTSTQALSWPRWEVYNVDTAYGYYGWTNYVGYNTVPEVVKKATAELALKASRGDLSTDVSRLKDRVKVGPVDITYSHSDWNQNKIYTVVEGWLAPFLANYAKNGMAHVVRLERS